MVTIGTLNGGNITITTEPATRAVTRIWWSNDESDFSDYPSNSGTFDSSCIILPEGKNDYDAVKVEFGSDVTSIGDSTLYGYENLTDITIPESVTSIGDWVFTYCSKLTRVNITDIAKWCSIAFSDNQSCPLDGANLYLNGNLVTNLTIPDGVTSIGKWAFYSCAGLTSLTIPDSVTSIGVHAFEYCSLTSVTITGNDATKANNVKQMLISAGVSSSITWIMPS